MSVTAVELELGSGPVGLGSGCAEEGEADTGASSGVGAF